LRSTHDSLDRRLGAIDWNQVRVGLDAEGHARLPGLLTPTECRSVGALWHDAARFRSVVDMARHGFGSGEYRYFAAPLPALVRVLRERLYRPLAVTARRWAERLGQPAERFPASLRAFRAICHAAEQDRPTPLLLRYHEGDWNALHQDLYGAVAFPLQVAIVLSPPERFTGGEFVLVEQRPRAQSRPMAFALGQGEGLVFTNRERPVAGRRGDHRVAVRHGVSRILSGERLTLGIIFHDAR